MVLSLRDETFVSEEQRIDCDAQRWRSGKARPMNALLLAFGNAVQYRALRCTAAAGLRAYVLGTDDALLLRRSRFCQTFLRIPGIADVSRENLDLWVERIEAAASRFAIDIVIPADGVAALLIARIRDRLSIPSFPTPAPETFARLNNKWSFYQTCLDWRVPAPATWLFADRSAVLEAMRKGQLPSRIIVKPAEMWGGIGVVLVTAQNAEAALASLGYAPLLVQEFIEGKSFHLNIFAIRGAIVAAVARMQVGRSYRFSESPQFLELVSRIVAPLKADGVLNFDAQLTADGRIYLLECNPRMFLTMDYAAAAGMNFIALGLRDWEGFKGPPVSIPQKQIRTPLGLARALAAPWRVNTADIEMLRFSLADPVSFALECVRLVFRERTDF